MPEKKLSVGDKAPLFTLPDESGKKVALKDLYKKKIVLLFFYPGDMTSGCTIQLKAVKTDWKKFKDANIAVYGVNHADAESHQKFKERYDFPFPLLIDKDKKVSQKYQATKPFFKSVIIKRSVIAIGKDGKIIYLKRGMPKNSEILKTIKPYM